MLTPDDLIAEVRDASLARVGQLTTADLEGLAVVPRLNDVGSWEITLPELVLDDEGREVPHALCAALREEGAGLIVAGPDGEILSGPMTEARFAEDAESGAGSWTITGVSDAILLQDALAFPEPMNPDPATQGVTNDVRSGAAEDLLRGYVSANIGPAAPVARRVGFRSAIALDGPSLGRGGSFTASPRFDNLLTLCQTIAQASGLAFDVVQSGASLVFRVWEPADRSAFVRMDLDNGALKSVEVGFGAPTATRPIVAGQGEGVFRTIVERSSAATDAAEASWGRRIERFYDQRQTDDVAELALLGDNVLATEGVTVSSVRATPADDLASVFLRDWGVGDLVTVTVGELDAVARVTEAALLVSGGLVKVGATIGDPTGFEAEDVQSARISSTENRVSALERNAEASAVTKATVDPYWTEGLPSIQLDGTDYWLQDVPWIGSMPTPGQRVAVSTNGGTGAIILGSITETMSLGRYLPLTLPSGVVDYDAYNWRAAAVSKSSEGYVHVSGLVKLTGTYANGATIATLPPGFRPDYRLMFPANNTDTAKSLDVWPDGRINLRSGFADQSYVSLDNIVFPAAGVATWTTATLVDGWAAHADTTYGPPRYWRSPEGLVWVQGLIARSSAPTIDNRNIFLLPANARPAKELHLVNTAANGHMFIGADPNLGINFKTGSGTTDVTSYSITTGPFPAASTTLTPKALSLTGWSNYGATFPSAAVLKTPGGLVVSQGLLLGSQSNTPAFTPPVGYRYTGANGTAKSLRATVSAQLRGRADFAPSGGVALVQAQPGNWTSIDGHAWIAEA